MISQEQVQAAAEWAAAEFIKRTKAVEDGNGRVDELLPETRVSWSEVYSRFFDGCNAMAARLAFQEVFDNEMKRRTES